MPKRAKETQRKSEYRKPKPLQQFLQSNGKGGFEMVFVSQPKRPKNPSQMETIVTNSAPRGFKPTATSTPKRTKASFEGVAEETTKPGPRLTMSQYISEARNPGPRLTMSQFIGKLPILSKRKTTQQTAVELQNFVSGSSNTLDTFILDDFRDNDEHQVAISQTKKETKKDETTNLNYTKEALKIIFSKETSFESSLKSVLNAIEKETLNDTYQSFQKRFECDFSNDSMQITFEDIFKNEFNNESSSSISKRSKSQQTIKTQKEKVKSAPFDESSFADCSYLFNDSGLQELFQINEPNNVDTLYSFLQFEDVNLLNETTQNQTGFDSTEEF